MDSVFFMICIFEATNLRGIRNEWIVFSVRQSLMRKAKAHEQCFANKFMRCGWLNVAA